MSNYVQTTLFTPKDSLPTTNPAKTIFGAAYDVEFGNIAAAITSKVDTGTANQLAITSSTIAFAANVVIPTPASGIALVVNGFAGSSALQILGTGVQIGAPTGGDKGTGTLNLAVGAFVNNVPIAVNTSGTFVGTLTGMAGATTGTFNYEIVGKHVTLTCIAAVQGTSNATSMSLTGIPVAIQPATGIPSFLLLITDNGTSKIGFAQCSAATFAIGLFQNGTALFTSTVFTNFTATGLKGLPAGWTVTYSLD